MPFANETLLSPFETAADVFPVTFPDAFDPEFWAITAPEIASTKPKLNAVFNIQFLQMFVFMGILELGADRMGEFKRWLPLLIGAPKR